MRTLLLIYTLLILQFGLFAQNLVNHHELEFKDGKAYFKKQLFTGTSIFKTEYSKNKFEQTSYNKGVLNGISFKRDGYGNFKRLKFKNGIIESFEFYNSKNQLLYSLKGLSKLSLINIDIQVRFPHQKFDTVFTNNFDSDTTINLYVALIKVDKQGNESIDILPTWEIKNLYMSGPIYDTPSGGNHSDATWVLGSPRVASKHIGVLKNGYFLGGLFLDSINISVDTSKQIILQTGVRIK